MPSFLCPFSPAVEASDLKSLEGQFESDKGYQFLALIAQRSELTAHNRLVPGSSPGERTIGVGVGTQERLILALALDWCSRLGSNPSTPTNFLGYIMKKIEVQHYWRDELTKLRCWLQGYNDGRHIPGNLSPSVPGEMILRQIIMAIDDAKDTKK